MAASAILALTDPYEHQRGLQAVDMEIVVTAAGNYRAELKGLRFNQLWMQRSSQNLPFIGHANLHPNRAVVGFLAHDRQLPIGIFGAEICRGEICCLAVRDEYHIRTSGESCWASMSLSPDDLAAAGRILLGHDTDWPGRRLIQPPPHLMLKLLNLHQAACDLATTAPDILAQPEVSKALEQALVLALVTCLSDNAALTSTRGHVGRTTVMRKFEELIEAEPDTPLYLIDICDKIGVTSRTLRLHCQEQLGMGPHRYLWLRRMTLARRRLMRTEPNATTVTDIAMGYGFGELGRFAVQYHTLFGETPSETLRHPAR